MFHTSAERRGGLMVQRCAEGIGLAARQVGAPGRSWRPGSSRRANRLIRRAIDLQIAQGVYQRAARGGVQRILRHADFRQLNREILLPQDFFESIAEA